MQNIEKDFIQAAAEYDIAVSPEQAAAFQTYMELLVEWNEKVNLTAIVEPQQVLEKHFLDSLLLLKAVELPQNAKVIDVGTGAGFPGIPLKIMRPDIQLTLLDSLQKRLNFLKEVCTTLNVEAELVHDRAEEGGRRPQLREAFDLSCARAVAALPVLCEYCIPFIKVGGFFAAMKGPGADEELESSARSAALLGSHMGKLKRFSLPDGSVRNIVVFKKRSATSDKYPRHGSKIAKKPL